MKPKSYSYEDDDFNRYLGEPVDYDNAGAIRQKTWRWWWQKIKYQWKYFRG